MAQWTHDELTDALAEVARRSSVDPDFRTLALTNPNAALKKVSGNDLPAEMDIKFVDNSGSVKYVPLPDPVSGLEELSEAELEAIAGGDYFITGNFSQGPSGPTYAASGAWHR